MQCIETFRAFRQTNICVDAESLWLRISVLLDRLDPSFYFCVRTRAMVCIYASAYVTGLGSGTPEYTCWNVKCVFWAARGRGMSPKLTVTTFKYHDRRACVMSDSRWRVRARARVRLWGLLITITCVHVNRRTDEVTCLSPPQHCSNVCVLIGVCFISARKRERVSQLQSMGLSFFFCWGGIWTTFGRCLLVFNSDL